LAAGPRAALAAAGSGPDRNVGVLCAALGALGFSFKSVLIKGAYRYGVDAETLLCLRMAYALPWLLLMTFAQQRREPLKLSRRDWFEFAVLGLFGYYLSSYLDFLGLRYISAALERIVVFIYPTLVVVLSALFLGQPLKFGMVLMLAASYAGVALSVAGDLRPGAQGTATGVVLVLGSALSFAIYLMRSAQSVARFGSTRVTAYATSIACGLCVGQFICLRPLTALRQPWEVQALAAAMGVFSTVVPIWLYAEALRRLGAVRTAMIGSLGPIFTLLLAYVFLGEPLSVAQIGGAAIVIFTVSRLSRMAAL
jgi:drug/metabolite transporter (DMT)-like permease